MNFKQNHWAIALACSALLGVPAAAQSEAQLRNVSRIVVKPDRVAEFLEIEAKLTEASKKAGVAYKVVWRSYVGAAYEFLIITPLEKYAARDEPMPVTKSLKEGELSSLMARRAQCIESTRLTIERNLPDLGVLSPGAPAPVFARAVRTRVRPGMADQFMAGLKEVMDAYKKAGMSGVRTRRVEWGGSRNEFTTTVWGQKMAELDDASAVVKALGPEGAKKLTSKIEQTTNFTEWLIYRYVASVSYLPAQ
jgi:hypothetical protein